MQQTSFLELPRVEAIQVVNVASVAQLSPFRYPGGKTWLVPFVLQWLKGLPARPSQLIDPFLGGGSVPLAALLEERVDHLILGELDEDVAAVWQCIFSDQNDQLCDRILRFGLTREAVQAVLTSKSHTLLDRAFATILRNRTYRGGILASGASLMKDGENGRGIASRWYPQTLSRRLKSLSEIRRYVEFIHGDALRLIWRYLKDERTVFFVDPPYTAGKGKRAGKRLYKHHQLDHEQLFGLMSQVRGDFLMTYDDDPDVWELAQGHNFDVERIPMKNAHHEKKFELVISRRSRVVATPLTRNG